uniref:Toll-like receptor 7 n=1 Tax=Sphaerodactylus townsendi TaxID=933632 RepID=A0ACB8FHX0_9SAUR
MMTAIQYPKTLPCDVSPLKDLLLVDCTNRHLTTFPNGIPANTTNLTLSINHINDIKKANFEHLEKLVEIDFSSAFQNLTKLTVLSLKGNNLTSNAMSQTLHGNEFRFLSGLKYLDFSNNRVDLLYSNAFQELKELEILDLSDNKYYFQVEGVTHMLNFTRNLTSLKKLILNGNEIFTSADKGMASSSIKTLEFRKNRLDILWKDGTDYLSFFKELKGLENLDISDNSLSFIPGDVFDRLPPQLQNLSLSNNKLKMFPWEKLQVLKNLKHLDLSNNQLTVVPPELSKCSGVLQILTLQHNRIKKLTENFLRGAFQLRHLDLSFNSIKIIRNSSFPQNVINNLNELLLNGNPFKCNCDIVWLAWWMNKTNVTIPRLATDVTCSGPGAWKGKGVILLDLHTCELDYSQILYCVSSSIIMCLMTLTVTSHLYFWDVWYSYHFCIAKLKGYKRLFSSEVLYDAFIAYDIKDAAVNEWVLKELVEKLENEQEKQFNLCLEERDWLPGQPILDNLSESIEMSRKTVFVLTNRYIACGNFRTAFYLAHQRLMDEKADVIILVFLEKVLQKSKYLRLRKRLCSRSVLEWPTNPQSQCYFWHCLKNALTVNNDVSYNVLFKEMV